MTEGAIAVQLVNVATVPSTQDALHALAARGAPNGSAVVAVEQLAGRGSRGRSWASAPGGLWMSVLLRELSPDDVQRLPVRVALGLAETLSGYAGAELAVKWPNDLLLQQRKLGGVLCEARWNGTALSWVAVGIGINVQNVLPPELARSSIRLGDVAAPLTSNQLVQPVRDAVLRAAAQRGLLTDRECAAWTARDSLDGQSVESPVSGVVRGIAQSGALVIQRPDGTRRELMHGRVEPANGAELA